MDITIKGKNVDLSDELVEYAKQKVGRLEKIWQRVQSATVNFTEGASKKRSKSFRAEVVLRAPGQTLRSEEEKESFRTALDSALAKLEEQLRRTKTKRIDKSRDRSVTAPALVVEPPAAEPQFVGPVVYVDRFNLKPLSAAEAISALQIEPRDFMVFVNESGVVNCIYRRKDGNFGLLVPEDELS